MFLKNLEFKSLDSLKTLTYQPLINYTPENGVNFNFYIHTHTQGNIIFFFKKKNSYDQMVWWFEFFI